MNKVFFIMVKSEVIQKLESGTLSFPSEMRADIYVFNIESEKYEKIEENAVIQPPLNTPTNQYYEKGKYYKVEMRKNNDSWELIRYIGEVSDIVIGMK